MTIVSLSAVSYTHLDVYKRQGIDNRIGMDIIVIHLALEPEAELLCLCAGTFYHIAAVQQQVGVKFLSLIHI